MLLPGDLAYVVVARVRWQLRGLVGFLAQRVGILARDTEQVAFDVYGETAAEGLRDVTLLSLPRASR